MSSPEHTFSMYMSLVKENRSATHNHRNLSQALSFAFENLGPDSWDEVLTVNDGAWLITNSELSSKEISLSALRSLNVEAVSWWLCHDSWAGCAITPGADNQFAPNEVSSMLFKELEKREKNYPSSFVGELFRRHPQLCQDTKVYYSDGLHSALCRAMKEPEHFQSLLVALSCTISGKDYSNPQLWIRQFCSSATARQAKKLLELINDYPKVKEVVSSCFPLTLPEYTLPGKGVFLGNRVSSVCLNSVHQALAWSKGSAMIVAFEDPSADNIWQHPQRFESWILSALHHPTSLSRLLSKHETLQKSFESYRSVGGMNCIHLMAHVRLLYPHVDFSRLQDTVCKMFPKMYTDQSNNSYELSVPHLLAQHFPEWNSAWKRHLLGEVSQIQPDSSPPLSKPKM